MDMPRDTSQLLHGENDVLKLILDRAPLPIVLEALVRLAERHGSTELLGSILLMDRDGVHLRHGAAPSLPTTYCQAIDGLVIGPNVGSCGTAAYHRKPVVVSDISSDPLWTDFRDLAAQHGLRACWSSPILSPSKAVLGTFALYYRQPGSPTGDDEAMIDTLMRTAALAIEHHSALNELSESEERHRSVARCAPIGLFVTDASGAFSYVNPRFVELSGYEYEKTFDLWLEAATGDPRLGQEWRQMVESRGEYSRDFALSERGDREMSLRVAPLRSGAGAHLGFVGTLEGVHL